MNAETNNGYAVLAEQMKQVAASIAEIKNDLKNMPTRREIEAFVSRAEHSSAVVALDVRLKDVERKVDENSPKSLMQTVQQIAITISALGAAGGLLFAVFAYFAKGAGK